MTGIAGITIATLSAVIKQTGAELRRLHCSEGRWHVEVWQGGLHRCTTSGDTLSETLCLALAGPPRFATASTAIPPSA